MLTRPPNDCGPTVQVRGIAAQHWGLTGGARRASSSPVRGRFDDPRHAHSQRTCDRPPKPDNREDIPSHYGWTKPRLTTPAALVGAPITRVWRQPSRRHDGAEAACATVRGGYLLLCIVESVSARRHVIDDAPNPAGGFE